jgi:hypothetical protein
MTYASEEDLEALRKYFTDDDFKAALDNPHLGFSTEVPGRNGISAPAALPCTLPIPQNIDGC